MVEGVQQTRHYSTEFFFTVYEWWPSDKRLIDVLNIVRPPLEDRYKLETRYAD